MLEFLLNTADSSFVRLFTEMNGWTIVIFVLGLIFCAIEMFVPGFGFFGGCGIALLVVGIILRMVSGGDVYMLLYMVLIAMLLVFLMCFVFGRMITKGRLGKTSVFNVGTSVPEDKTEGTRDFSTLLGCEGVATTSLKPIGKAAIDGEVFDVVARDGFVEEGACVTVIETEGQRVVVKEK